MAQFAKTAAEIYLVVGVLVTSLLADNDRGTSSLNDLDISQTGTEISPEVLVMATSMSLQLEMTNASKIPGDPENVDANTIAPDEPAATAAQQPPTDPSTRHRMFAMPHFRLSDLPDTRWGPFFEGGNEDHNITARVGSTVNLDCRIGLLQDKTVTWLHHKEDSIHLLTVGRQQYSSDDRIELNFRYPNNYRLKIAYVTRREEGLYECQVATHPTKVKRIFLKVIAPEVRITDESGRQVTERYYKAGSGLELACNARQVGATAEELPVSWRHDDILLTKGISSNVSAATDSASATLTIAPLQKKHSGNYTCAVGALAAAAVAVHVLNGELPAAVQSAAGTGDTSLQLILAAACVTVWRLR
ncbi:limbic system-associated membrane protein-like [Atheta coriaria]|uniref:limbic system-associated membrane protein-like n=1 Tax=Dalotia coriaria TaxID=877792 RepID=UPI0031F4080E